MPAAALPWISAGLGGLGLWQGAQRNNEAQNQSNQQFALQASEIGRQNQLFDMMMRLANQANQSGQFDPTKRLQLLNQEVKYGQGAADSSAAGAARELGYKPGDTAPLDTINQIHGNFGLQLRQMANDIYNQSFQQKMAAYEAANPGSLNAAIGATGQNAQFDWSKMQNLGGLLGSIGPYLNPQYWQQGQSAPNGRGIIPFNPASIDPVVQQGGFMGDQVQQSAPYSMPSAPSFGGTPNQAMGAGPLPVASNPRPYRAPRMNAAPALTF